MNIKVNIPLLFFDTETTGIIKDKENNIISNGDLIQLAYRLISDGKKEDKNIFFDTDTKIEIGAMAIHGIYKKLLLEKSNGHKINDEDRKNLSNIFSNNIIIAHNIDFDNDVLSRSGISYTDKQIDTLKIAKILLSEGILKNKDGFESELLNLQYLRYFFELYEINDENGNKECTTAHDAFGDVVVLEKVFYKLFNLIKNKLNISDLEVLEKMLKMSKKKFFLIKTMRFGKYKGRTFEEVLSLDKGYLEWMIKANFPDDVQYTCKVLLGLEEDKKFFKN